MDTEPKKRKERVGNPKNRLLHRITVLFVSTGAVVAIVASAYSEWGIVALGVSIVSVGLGLFAIDNAVKADFKMKALANVEFYDRFAVLKEYCTKNVPEEWHLEPTIKAAIQLEPWLDSAQKNEFRDAFRNTLKRLKEQHHNVALGRLRDLWKRHGMDDW